VAKAAECHRRLMVVNGGNANGDAMRAAVRERVVVWGKRLNLSFEGGTTKCP
jgi:hypothetical protein